MWIVFRLLRQEKPTEQGEEFDKAIHAYETMKRECKIDLCASMGFLTAEQPLHRLHEAGVNSYHHNIETSRRNFPNICTTHTYDMKIETLKKVKAEGMYACSRRYHWNGRDMGGSSGYGGQPCGAGGVISIPINALNANSGYPVGTPAIN